MHIQMSIEVQIKLDVEDADVVVSFRAGCIWCRIPASQHGSYAATPKYKYKPIQAEIQTQIYTEYNNNCQLKIAMNQKWTVAWQLACGPSQKYFDLVTHKRTRTAQCIRPQIQRNVRILHKYRGMYKNRHKNKHRHESENLRMQGSRIRSSRDDPLPPRNFSSAHFDFEPLAPLYNPS